MIAQLGRKEVKTKWNISTPTRLLTHWVRRRRANTDNGNNKCQRKSQLLKMIQFSCIDNENIMAVLNTTHGKDQSGMRRLGIILPIFVQVIGRPHLFWPNGGHLDACARPLLPAKCCTGDSFCDWTASSVDNQARACIPFDCEKNWKHSQWLCVINECGAEGPFPASIGTS